MYNLKDWVLNYAAYNTLGQMENTASTDLAFKQDLQNNKLYINVLDDPGYITLEYVPKLNTVEDVKSAYWQDILLRLSVALTKIALGRIRGRFQQTNALWAQDAETMLSEGNDELKTLRETLRANASMILPID